MRRTTINLTDEFEAKINDLSKVIDTKDMIRVFEVAVEHLHRQYVRGKATYRPVYTEVYVHAAPDLSDAFPVRHVLYGGGISYLKKATFAEALAAEIAYVLVAHALEYPDAYVDYETIKPDNWPPLDWMPEWKPARFVSAAIVAVPQATIVGPGGDA
jgi:hypothetical protein